MNKLGFCWLEIHDWYWTKVLVGELSIGPIHVEVQVCDRCGKLQDKAKEFIAYWEHVIKEENRFIETYYQDIRPTQNPYYAGSTSQNKPGHDGS